MRTLATTISTGTVTVLAAARTVGLSKVYGHQGETRVVALDNVSIDFADGEARRAARLDVLRAIATD